MKCCEYFKEQCRRSPTHIPSLALQGERRDVRALIWPGNDTDAEAAFLQSGAKEFAEMLMGRCETIDTITYGSDLPRTSVDQAREGLEVFFKQPGRQKAIVACMHGAGDGKAFAFNVAGNLSAINVHDEAELTSDWKAALHSSHIFLPELLEWASDTRTSEVRECYCCLKLLLLLHLLHWCLRLHFVAPCACYTRDRFSCSLRPAALWEGRQWPTSICSCHQEKTYGLDCMCAPMVAAQERLCFTMTSITSPTIHLTLTTFCQKFFLSSLSIWTRRG
jgi:hypothetical protein